MARCKAYTAWKDNSEYVTINECYHFDPSTALCDGTESAYLGRQCKYADTDGVPDDDPEC